ncbi:MAG TPA: ATP-binding protein [Candidatus Omnitrophota bacterium]|nr:ATP-binding protein [Candidatus Omnitrophota bacterium]
MIISVASGKGGTGKTTVAVNLALSLGKCRFLDCDVEEPNAHLFLKPAITETVPVTVPVPSTDQDRCTHCGICQTVCNFHAIAVVPATEERPGKFLHFPELCHGCGACGLLCPEKAIAYDKRVIGWVDAGRAQEISFAHGRLQVGEVMSPPLIKKVRSYADSGEVVIIDAPPGTSCPMIASTKGSDFCILVTEPTPFGLNDLKLAVEVVRKSNIPFGVIINRSDIGDGRVENYCRAEAIPVLLSIPFDRKIAEWYSQGIPLVENKSDYQRKFRGLIRDIKKETEAFK